jgi:hypothetical protein
MTFLQQPTATPEKMYTLYLYYTDVEDCTYVYLGQQSHFGMTILVRDILMRTHRK